MSIPTPNVQFDKNELRERLTLVEFRVTQEKSTEKPYSNQFYKHRGKGVYTCKICGEELFASKTKYESGSGWPSFYDVIDKTKVVLKPDSSGVGCNLLLIVKRPDLIRTEVTCRNCGSHLGHVFKDGPQPTGLRYCINSSSLDFSPAQVVPINGSADSVDGSECSRLEQNEEEDVIVFPATIGGCGGGSNGACSLKSKQAVKSRLKEIDPGLMNVKRNSTEPVQPANKDAALSEVKHSKTEEDSSLSSTMTRKEFFQDMSTPQQHPARVSNSQQQLS